VPPSCSERNNGRTRPRVTRGISQGSRESTTNRVFEKEIMRQTPRPAGNSTQTADPLHRHPLTKRKDSASRISLKKPALLSDFPQNKSGANAVCEFTGTPHLACATSGLSVPHGNSHWSDLRPGALLNSCTTRTVSPTCLLCFLVQTRSAQISSPVVKPHRNRRPGLPGSHVTYGTSERASSPSNRQLTHPHGHLA